MAMPPDPPSPPEAVDAPTSATVRTQLGLAALVFVLTGVGLAGLRARSAPRLTLSPPPRVRHVVPPTRTRTLAPTPTTAPMESSAAPDDPAVDTVTEPAWSPPPSPPGASGDCASMPAWFPEAIAWRESNCRYDVASAGGAYFGAYQIADFHWRTGACSDLDWTVPAHQDECAWRLSAGGTDFSAWGA